jgi:superfamily II DNA or RNA helicase
MATQPKPRLTRHAVDDLLSASIGPGTGLAFARAYFPLAGATLRIATAYFSVNGYSRAERYVPDATRIRVLVGRGERDRRAVQAVVLDEVAGELQAVEADALTAAVEGMVAQIASGRLRVADARGVRPKFHCKYYVVSDRALWHGSANLSDNGLDRQAEQATAVTDPAVVRQWSQWFDDVSAESDDLTEDLAQELREWLGLATPFSAYLAALAALFPVPDVDREAEALEPAYYQRALAAWGLEQLDRYRGALFVVSTGLGKTVIGAEIAGALEARGDLRRLVLVAPLAVHRKWRVQLEARHVVPSTFDTGLLFKEPSGDRLSRVGELDALVERADARTLILIDEAHVYRNQVLRSHTEPAASRVLQRMQRAAERGASVVLMTGSAYATDVQNLLSQLRLLPPVGPLDFAGRPAPWVAQTTGAFTALPVVATLGYPHVLAMAERRGDRDERGPYLPFDAPAYVPTAFRSRIVRYALPVQDVAMAAFDAGAFDAKVKTPHVRYDDEAGVTDEVTDTLFNTGLTAWASSPRAFRLAIWCNLATIPDGETRPLEFDGHPEHPTDLFGAPGPVRRVSPPWVKGYEASFRRSYAGRRAALEPLLPALVRSADDKVQRLADELRALHAEQPPLKALVFVERLETALHVVAQLRRRTRRLGLRIGTTVGARGRKAVLKSEKERLRLRWRFAPRAHGEEPGPDSLHVLVCTDADGVGVDLQDASVVVNYDLPSGADGLVQRLGRVLRATPEPRPLTVLTFVPRVALDPPDGRSARSLASRYDRLVRREGRSRRVLGSGALPPRGETDAVISLRTAVDVAAALTPAADGEVGGLAGHFAVLEEHRDEAERLVARPRHTSRLAPVERQRLVVVFRAAGRVRTVVFDPRGRGGEGEIESDRVADALGLLRCAPSAPPAPPLEARPSRIPGVAGRAIRAWCEREGVEPDPDARIAAVLLVPGDPNAPAGVV